MHQNQPKFSILERIYLSKTERLKKSIPNGKEFVRSSISAANQRYKQQQNDGQTQDKPSNNYQRLISRHKKSFDHLSMKSLKQQTHVKGSRNDGDGIECKHRLNKTRQGRREDPEHLKTIMSILRSNNNGIVFKKSTKQTALSKNSNKTYSQFGENFQTANNIKIQRSAKNERAYQPYQSFKNYYYSSSNKIRNSNSVPVNKREALANGITRESTISSEIKEYLILNECNGGNDPSNPIQKEEKSRKSMHRKYNFYKNIERNKEYFLQTQLKFKDCNNKISYKKADDFLYDEIQNV